MAGFIQQNGLLPQMLLNTHCHLDHVFGNKFVNESWGLPCTCTKRKSHAGVCPCQRVDVEYAV